MANAFFRRRPGRAAIPILALASNLPDVDVLVHVTLSPTAILMRRTFGHSFFTLPGWCALLAILLGRFFPEVRRGTLFALALLGAGVHLFFDLVNSFGVVLLWPFSDWRPELAMVFIIDLVLTGLLLLPLLICLPRGLRPRLAAASRAGLACAAIYVILCGAARLRAERMLAAEASALEPRPRFTYVFPEPFGPQRWRGVVRQEDTWFVYLIRPLSGGMEKRRIVGTQEGDPRVERVRATRLGSRLEWFFKAPVWKVREAPSGAGGPDGPGGGEPGTAIVGVHDLRFTSLVLERRGPFVYWFRVRADGRVERLHRLAVGPEAGGSAAPAGLSGRAGS